VDPDYASISVPTLILAGTEDNTAPEATISFLSGAIPGADVVMLQDVGHWLIIEDVEEVSREIHDVLYSITTCGDTHVQSKSPGFNVYGEAFSLAICSSEVAEVGEHSKTSEASDFEESAGRGFHERVEEGVADGGECRRG